MKQTAMQELLQVESDLTRMFDSDLRVAMWLLEHLRANKSEILEKEKEQMRDVWDDSRAEYMGDAYIGKEKSFEEYHNETFNTKEK
jgi:hypothetical protein